MSTYVKKHNRDAVFAGRQYALNAPFEGKYAERVAKLDEFINDLLEAYGCWTTVTFDPEIPKDPARTKVWYDAAKDTVVVYGGFSVLATLHAVALAIEADRDFLYSQGPNDHEYARRWSQGLFAKLFPAEWEELVLDDAEILRRFVS